MEKFIQHFETIARQEHGEVLFKDQDIPIAELGARSPHAVFFLKIDYKGSLIEIRNSLGTEFAANTSCEISYSSLRGNFEIRTRERIFRIFNNKNKPFIIKADDQHLEYRLRENPALKRLEHLANTTDFEPYIQGISKMNTTKVRMNYHLKFDGWEEMVEPVIAFYKSLIDEFSYED